MEGSEVAGIESSESNVEIGNRKIQIGKSKVEIQTEVTVDLPPENCTSVNESSPGYKSPRRTRNEAESVHGGADHRGVEASGGRDQDGG
ncbi:MAG TPA: hypothetical protein VG028_04830, partial [Terriglobia bacterium]|nr:hypothetical protein [Terriglobia bacterium]